MTVVVREHRLEMSDVRDIPFRAWERPPYPPRRRDMRVLR